MKRALLFILLALPILPALGQTTVVGNDWFRVIDNTVYDLTKGHKLWHTNGIKIEQVLTNGLIATMWLDGIGTNKPTLAFIKNFNPAPPIPPAAPGQTGKIVCMKTGTFKHGDQILDAWDIGTKFAVTLSQSQISRSPKTNTQGTAN